MADTRALQPVNERGWARGFKNMWLTEAHKWWGTRFGLRQIAIWVLITNGVMAIVLLGDMAVVVAEGNQGPGVALEPFVMLSTALPIIGAIILAQGAVVGEKTSGTAEWVLSAPVSRVAFLLSRLLALFVGCTVTMLLFPFAVAALEYHFIPSPSIPFPADTMLTVMGMSALQLLFYLCLTIMLGTMFSSRNPVIGIAIAVYIAVPIVVQEMGPTLTSLTPTGLTQLSVALVHGESASSILPVAATVAWALLFMALAIWRFQREDF